MAYLVAKYAVIFLLTSLFAFWLGWWWARRWFVEVTESFSSLMQAQKTADASFAELRKRLTALDGIDDRLRSMVAAEVAKVPQPDIPDLDLSGVVGQLGVIEKNLGDIPQPPPVTFDAVNTRIDKLDAAIRGLPKPSEPKTVDLGPLQARIDKLDAAIRGLPKPSEPKTVDLGPLQARIDKLDAAIRGLPKPTPVDLGPLQARIDRVEAAVSAIKLPEAPTPVNLAPVHEKIRAVEQAVLGIRIPEPAKPLNLVPVNERIAAVEKSIREIRIPEASRPVDLEPVNQKMAALEHAISKIRIPEPGPRLDLAPTHERIRVVEEAVRAIRIPEPVNLKVTQERLSRIEAQLAKLLERPAAPPPPPKPKGPRLLTTAEYGPKDDLKRISGVGPKLERLLNQNGVFYFWQVASWNKADVDYVDARLDVFKGRIERDNWVAQGKKLKGEPGSGKEPVGGGSSLGLAG